MVDEPTLTARQVGLPVAAAGALGLGLSALADGLGWPPNSAGETFLAITWKVGMLGILAVSVIAASGHLPGTGELGLAHSPLSRHERHQRLRLAGFGTCVAVAGFLLVSRIGIGRDPMSADSYSQSAHVGAGVAALALAVRYPLTALAEETLFRGWLQPRLGRFGIPITAALWASYHVTQPATIPALFFLGLSLGVARWVYGSVRVGIVAHYLIDAAFFVATYL